MRPSFQSSSARRLRRSILGIVAAATLLVAGPVAAQGTDDPTGDRDDEGEMDLEAISRALDNPLGNLWLIFMQNELVRFRGIRPMAPSGSTPSPSSRSGKTCASVARGCAMLA